MKLKSSKYFFPAVSCLLLAGLLTFTRLRTGSEALAARIAPEILRLHVLANSDSTADQHEKLEVRSLLLEYLRTQLPADATKENTIDYIQRNTGQLKNAAETYLAASGHPKPVRIELVQDYFPSKTYGNLTFPCGTYDALRVSIGTGKGHNWWCVVYPQLCLVDAACDDMPAGSAAAQSVSGNARAAGLLESSIEKDDYLALLDNRPQISFKIQSLLHPVLPQN